MPPEAHSLPSTTIHTKIKLLIKGLVEIKDTTGAFLLRLPDGRVIDTKGWHDWEWTHGIGLYGIWKYYSLTSNPEYLSIIESWFADRFAAGGTTKNINTMAVFLTLAYVYELNGKMEYLPWLDAWAEWAYHDLERTRFGGMQHITYLEENRGQLWDDTLMMTVLPLAKIGKLLNRPHYVAEATKQFLIHIKYLMDPETGLWFHGWQFEEEGKGKVKQGHNFARARWARGNSWITIAIPEFLELVDLPADDAVRQHLVHTLQAQISALVELQAESGLWFTLLDETEAEGSYLEASATAGFAYGMLKALRMRLVPESERKIVEECAIKAIKGVLECVNTEGELEKTSFGTGMGRDLKHYRDIAVTTMPYGQAMAIMALGEWARIYI